MFFLDSLMISGIRWTLETVAAAAEAELNDDSALRARLLEAEMQREMGEISEEEFARAEAELLQAIREIKARREGGSGAFAFGGEPPIDTGDGRRLDVEAEIIGDFYGPAAAAEPAAEPPRRRGPRATRVRPAGMKRAARRT